MFTLGLNKMYKKEIVLYIGMVAFFTIFALVVGIHVENSRIYSKCMENNDQLIRAEAVDICSRIVR